MLGREQIAALIPHQGEMCLLERVIEWDADHIVAETSTHRSPTNPLRLDGRLRALHLCEYGAQAMAIHGGLTAHAKGHTGAPQPALLVLLRDITLQIDFIEHLDGDLRVLAHRLLETTGGWQYSFTVEHRSNTLATGRAAILAPRG